MDYPKVGRGRRGRGCWYVANNDGTVRTYILGRMRLLDRLEKSRIAGI